MSDARSRPRPAPRPGRATNVAFPGTRAPGGPRRVALPLLALLAAAPPAGAAGQDSAAARQPERPLTPRSTSNPVRIDGALDEPDWARTPAVRLPFEVRPGRNAPAAVATECRILYGDDEMYVGCRARDPDPSRIRAHLTDRDDDPGDDAIAIRLDTFRDRRTAFVFSVNPLGVQTDGLAGTGFSDESWDAIWRSAGRVTGSGFSVEMAIPYRALRFAPTGARAGSWGVLFERTRPRSVSQLLRSSPVDFGDPCRLCEMHPVAAPVRVRGGLQVEVNPTLTMSATESRPDPTVAGFPDADTDLRPGLFARWRATPGVTVAATANPDFSQVESDAARLDLNRRFTLSFPEKRPFFVEGADLFDTPGDPLVFTRTITDPSVAVKSVGKTGGSAFGVLLARDAVTSVVVPGRERSDEVLLERGHTSAVARFRQDVGESSAAGGVATLREGAGYRNVVLAGDARIRPGGGFDLSFLLAGSHTAQGSETALESGSEEGTFEGFWARTVGRFGTREWEVTGQLEGRSDGFRADAGFVPEVGFREASIEFNRLFWAEDPGWFTVLGVGMDVDYGEFADGRLRNRSIQLLLDYSGPAQIDVDIDLLWEDQVLEGIRFAKNEQEIEVAIVPSGDIAVELEVARGRDVDTRNLRPADKLEASAGLEWRLGRHSSVALGAATERLSAEGRHLFTERAANLTLEHHFDRRAYLRGVLRLEEEISSPSPATGPGESAERGASTQLLFAYEMNPRSVLFLGYSDGWDGTEEAFLRQTRRTLFAKVGYALQL